MFKSMQRAVTGWMFGSSLRTAVREGNLPRVQSLIDQGADPCSMDSYGWSALHIAAMGTHETHVEMMRLFVSRDVNVNFNGGGDIYCGPKFPPLALAVASGRVELVRLLIEKGADPLNCSSFPRSDRGWSPVHAVAYIRFGQIGDTDILGYLLDHTTYSPNDYLGEQPRHRGLLYKARNAGCMKAVKMLLGEGARFETILLRLLVCEDNDMSFSLLTDLVQDGLVDKQTLLWTICSAPRGCMRTLVWLLGYGVNLLQRHEWLAMTPYERIRHGRVCRQERFESITGEIARRIDACFLSEQRRQEKQAMLTVLLSMGRLVATGRAPELPGEIIQSIFSPCFAGQPLGDCSVMSGYATSWSHAETITLPVCVGESAKAFMSPESVMGFLQLMSIMGAIRDGDHAVVWPYLQKTMFQMMLHACSQLDVHTSLEANRRLRDLVTSKGPQALARCHLPEPNLDAPGSHRYVYRLLMWSHRLADDALASRACEAPTIK